MIKRNTAAAVAIAVMMLASHVNGANITEQLKLSDAVVSMKFAGDLRVRDENFSRDNAAPRNRHRERFRLRIGSEIELSNKLAVNLRFASGAGEQVSTNQSYDNLGSQKSLYIDIASLQWFPYISETASAYLATGRMKNMLWKSYSSDIIWDDDFNPEGFSQGVEWLASDGLSVFANTLQMAADEDSSTGRGQWLFSQQAGFETKLPLESRIKLGAAYHKWSRENAGTFSQTAVQQGNRRTAGGVLLNRFGIGELTAQVSAWPFNIPLSLQATLARNFSAKNNGTTITGPKASDGYQFGFILGHAKGKNTWEAAMFRKYSETDVTVADIADSDFGEGGTNRKGSIFWIAYNPQNWLQAKAKYFATKVIDAQFAPGPYDDDRLQLDLSVKF